MKTRTNTPPDIEQFKKILKEKGLKATPQRLAVHQAMLSIGHASADMVVDYMAADPEAKVTTASVYNILSTLADLHIYRRLMSSDNKMHFDVNASRHFHIYDTKGDEFKDIFDDELIELLDSHFKGRRFRGYKVSGIDVQVICQATKHKSGY